jgi:hypothetical protein
LDITASGAVPVVDGVDLATVLQKFEVVVDLPLTDIFVFPAESVVDDAASVVSGKPLPVVVLALFDGPPEDLQCAFGVGRETPLHAAHSSPIVHQ